MLVNVWKGVRAVCSTTGRLGIASMSPVDAIGLYLAGHECLEELDVQ